MKEQKVTVYCALIYKDEILLLERKEPNVFEFPGGGIEFGESPKNAVIREVREETGIILKEKDVKLLEVSSAIYPDGETQQIIILYATKINEKPEISLSIEHKNYKWFKINEIEKIKNLALSVKACFLSLKKF